MLFSPLIKQSTQLFIILTLTGLTAALNADERMKYKQTLVWPDGTRYVGGVVNGKRDGKGTIFWQDGTQFVGRFKEGRKNGPGTLLLPDGSMKNAYFENDVLVPSPASYPAHSDDTTTSIVITTEPPEPRLIAGDDEDQSRGTKGIDEPWMD